MTDKLFWTDIETTGLVPGVHDILEVGFIVTDLELEEIDSFAFPVYWNGDFDSLDKFIVDMHSKNNLLADCSTSPYDLTQAEDLLVRFLERHGVTKDDPLCGSSVHFDRTFLGHYTPKVERLFSYRNIDISTIKELCRRYNPELLEKLPPQQKLHRVLPDLDDTINEFQFYRDEFLIWE